MSDGSRLAVFVDPKTGFLYCGDSIGTGLRQFQLPTGTGSGSGGGITAGTGDVTFSGTGSVATTLVLSVPHTFTAPQGCTVGTLTSSNSVTPAWNSGAGNDFTLTMSHTWLTPTINAPSGSPPTNADMCIYTTQDSTGGVQPTFDPASYVWGNGGLDAQPLANTTPTATDTWAFKLRPDGKWHGTKIGQSGPVGAGYGGTSTTSLTIASSGLQTITTQSGLAYLPLASRVRLSSRSSGAYMEGVTATYVGTALAFTADLSSGSGTFTDWNLSLTGAQGIQGVPGPAGLGSGVNNQSGTTYTVLISDASKLISFNSASPVAVTVPQATGSFGSPFKFSVENTGTGIVTLTPTTSNVDGAGSLALTTSQGCDWSSDGTNWRTQRGIGGGSTYHGFSAWASATTALTSGTDTKVNFATKEWDPDTAYSTANSRFTPIVAGKYLVTANIQAGSGVTVGVARIYKNGVFAKGGNLITNSGGTMFGSVSAQIDMNGTTDYLEIWVNGNGASPTVAISQTESYFQAALQ